MKIPIYDLKGASKGEINVNKAFSQPLRKDLIKKAVSIERANKRQPYGADPLAGKRTSAHYHGRRQIFHSMMNREMARMKRIHTMGFLNYRARFVPQAIKGRKAHPPKSEKVLLKKMNDKERHLALLSAISATTDKNIVTLRGHLIDGIKNIPMIIDDAFQDIKKNKEVTITLKDLGFGKELKRTSIKKVRAGKGTMRGRKYKTKKGPLVIINKDNGISKAARNILGLEIVNVKNLSVSLLAPGSSPGRLCLWTKSAIEELDKKAK